MYLTYVGMVMLELTCDTTASGMERLRRLHAMPYSLYLHEPKTPLPKLRKRLLRCMFKQDYPATPPRHNGPCAR
jgi:hypothetical protein